VARRNQLAFGAAAAVTLALIVGAIVSIGQAVRATQAERRAKLAQANEAAHRQQAEQNAAKSQRVARFLKQTLQGVASVTSRDRKVLQSIWT
jgi:hypothetical protein